MSNHRHTLLPRFGLAVAPCGLVLFLNGIGTTVHYLYGQSHPVPPADAFSLELERTLARPVFLSGGLTVALRRLLPTVRRC